MGRGHAWLYHELGISIAESKPRYEEALEILRHAWTEERFSRKGQFWQVHNAQVAPPTPKTASAAVDGRDEQGNQCISLRDVGRRHHP